MKNGLGWKGNMYTFRGNEGDMFGRQAGDSMSMEEMNAFGEGMSMNQPSSQQGMFGLSNSQLNNVGTAFDIAQGLAGAVLGSKQLGLAEDKFAFDKNMMNKQYAMAKDAYDKQVKRAASIGSQMREGKVQ